MKLKIETPAQFVVKCFDCGFVNYIGLTLFINEYRELFRCKECEAPLFYFDSYGDPDCLNDYDDCKEILSLQCAKDRAITGTDKDADLWKEIFEEEKADNG